jgi:hypothetical protein
MNDRTNPPLVFHNKIAAFYWIVMVLFDAGVLAMTWLFFRDHSDFSIWWLVYFWCGAIGASWWAASQQKRAIDSYIRIRVCTNSADAAIKISKLSVS